MNKESWICDSCEETILQAKDGYVEWLIARVGEKHVGRGLRLVHHKPASPRAPNGSCYHDENYEFRQDKAIYQSGSLESFLKADGLMKLLSLLSQGALPKEEVIEMIKRLHIPGYEQARLHIPRAISEGVFEPNLPEGFYWQSNIQAVLKFAAEEQTVNS
jgi:hypothetical protein